jgi:RND family efflux transporter MFP subunit
MQLEYDLLPNLKFGLELIIMSRLLKYLYAVSLFSLSFSSSYAQEAKEKGMPPAQVMVSEMTSGMIAPEVEFIGTIFYQEVSDVAAEVKGRVEEVLFEEGERIKKSKPLVRLDSELLKKSIESTRASYEQALADLESTGIDLIRVEGLYKEGLVAEQSFDEIRFRVKGLEKKAESLKTQIEGLEVELRKKVISAPFGGVVIKKQTDRGEWLEPGGKVATIARDDVVDVIVNVTEEVMRFVKPGIDVKVTVAGKELTGKVSAIIPRGDIQTRTFPVKVRVKNGISLIEGMEARVNLPAGERKKGIIVPRDAVINRFGSNVAFTVSDSKAKMIKVKVISYMGLSAGIESDELKEGMKVITKGNERIMDGHNVQIQNSKIKGQN